MMIKWEIPTGKGNEMTDILFGWITKPLIMHSGLDRIVMVFELLTIIGIIFIGLYIADFIYKKTHHYDIIKRKWVRK